MGECVHYTQSYEGHYLSVTRSSPTLASLRRCSPRPRTRCTGFSANTRLLTSADISSASLQRRLRLLRRCSPRPRGHIVMSIIIRVAVAIIIVYDHPLHVAMVNKSTHPHRGIASEVKRHNASRKCLHAWADRRGSTQPGVTATTVRVRTNTSPLYAVANTCT